MTKQEFIEFYFRPGAPNRWLGSAYLKPVTCDCGDPECKGWKMVPADEPEDNESGVRAN